MKKDDIIKKTVDLADAKRKATNPNNVQNPNQDDVNNCI